MLSAPVAASFSSVVIRRYLNRVCWGDKFPRRLCDPLSPVILFYITAGWLQAYMIKKIILQGVGGHRFYVGVCCIYIMILFEEPSLHLEWLPKCYQKLTLMFKPFIEDGLASAMEVTFCMEIFQKN